MSVGESEDRDTTSTRYPSQYLELVRVTDRTIHVSAEDREKEVEYVVRNNADEEFGYVFLPLPEFRPNLKVFDEDGTRLNYFPNSEVEGILNDREEEEDEDVHDELKYKFNHMKYDLLVQLPPDKPLEPGKMRTIRTEFEDTDVVQFYDVTDPSLFRGWIADGKEKFFNIPKFEANTERYPGNEHDEFVKVIGTPGYTTVGEAGIVEGETVKDKDLHHNGLDEDTHVISARLPPADTKYRWEMEYDLVPSSTKLMKLLYRYWMFATAAGLLLLIGGSLSLLDSLSVPYQSLAETVTAGLATATLGVIFAVDKPWSRRYRILSIVPLVLHSSAFIIWTVQTTV